MLNVEIREIEPRDYQAVLALWNNDLGNRRVTAENIGETYEKMAADDRYHTFVALIDGAVAGFVTAVESLAAGFPVGYLKMNGLAVKAEYRRRGVATRLMNQLERLARERGLSDIGLASGFQREDAHKFYESIGYEKFSYYFTKRF